MNVPKMQFAEIRSVHITASVSEVIRETVSVARTRMSVLIILIYVMIRLPVVTPKAHMIAVVILAAKEMDFSAKIQMSVLEVATRAQRTLSVQMRKVVMSVAVSLVSPGTGKVVRISTNVEKIMNVRLKRPVETLKVLIFVSVTLVALGTVTSVKT